MGGGEGSLPQVPGRVEEGRRELDLLGDSKQCS